jgi:sulfur relay (sulfurtransferase) DsrF/TusC family protein
MPPRKGKGQAPAPTSSSWTAEGLVDVFATFGGDKEKGLAFIGMD